MSVSPDLINTTHYQPLASEEANGDAPKNPALCEKVSGAAKTHLNNEVDTCIFRYRKSLKCVRRVTIVLSIGSLIGIAVCLALFVAAAAAGAVISMGLPIATAVLVGLLIVSMALKRKVLLLLARRNYNAGIKLSPSDLSELDPDKKKPVLLFVRANSNSDHSGALRLFPKIIMENIAQDYEIVTKEVSHCNEIGGHIRELVAQGRKVHDLVINAHGSTDTFTLSENNERGEIYRFDRRHTGWGSSFKNGMSLMESNGRIILISCSTGRTNPVDGGCVAQTLADSFGRDVIAPTEDLISGHMIFSRSSGWLFTDPSGFRNITRIFRPAT